VVWDDPLWKGEYPPGSDDWVTVPGFNPTDPPVPPTITLVYIASMNLYSKNYGTQAQGYANAPLAEQFIVINDGSGALTGLTATLASGAAFEINVPLSHSALSVGGIATLHVRPKAGLTAGTYTDTLVINATELAAPVNVSLTFVVTAPPSGISLTDTYLNNNFFMVAYADAAGNVSFTSSAGAKYALIIKRTQLTGDGGKGLMPPNQYGGTATAPSCGGSISSVGKFITVKFGYDSGANMNNNGKSMLAHQKIIDDWFNGTAGLVTADWLAPRIKAVAVPVRFPVGDANGYVQNATINNTGVSVPDPVSGTLKAFPLSAAEHNQWAKKIGGNIAQRYLLRSAASPTTMHFVELSPYAVSTDQRDSTIYAIRPALWIEIQ